MALILREAGVDRLGTRAAVIEVLDKARRGPLFFFFFFFFFFLLD